MTLQIVATTGWISVPPENIETPSTEVLLASNTEIADTQQVFIKFDSLYHNELTDLVMDVSIRLLRNGGIEAYPSKSSTRHITINGEQQNNFDSLIIEKIVTSNNTYIGLNFATVGDYPIINITGLD